MAQVHGTGRVQGTALEPNDLNGMLDWAKAIKPLAVTLQAAGGPPALWTAAQACHESCGSGGKPTGLAATYFNLWGIKAADWQRQFGCGAVRLDTFEYVDGKREEGPDWFCACPDLETGFKVYAALLGFERYALAKTWRADPLMYGLEVWRSGWATNPEYITGEWGVPYWFKALWPLYQDTLPVREVAALQPPRVLVEIKNGRGRKLVTGWLDGTQTVASIRPLLDSLGYSIDWQPGPRQGPHTAVVKRVRGVNEVE
jgi:hypothetical protein